MQKITRMGKLALCALLILSAWSSLGFESLQAQNYPTKPINIVIPLGAGGQNDLVMRILSNFAPEYFGQPFVIRIMPGGGGAIGSNEVAKAKPDGYTLLSGHANCNAVLPAVEGRGKGPDDLEAVALLNASYSAFWVQKDAPWKNFKELLAWAKTNPDKLIYGNNGTWSSSDFSWRWLEMNAGFTSRNVPYDGGAQCTIPFWEGTSTWEGSLPDIAIHIGGPGRYAPWWWPGPSGWRTCPISQLCLRKGTTSRGWEASGSASWPPREPRGRSSTGWLIPSRRSPRTSGRSMR
jgi:hypothetical protein